MGIKTTYSYKPDYAVHPGEYLEEVLESREIKKKDLAKRLGISDKHLSQIIHKQALLTAHLALQLERVFGISANIWNNMNAQYTLFEARLKEIQSLNRQKQWIKGFPIADLKKLGFISNTNNAEAILEQLLEFFGISTPELWEKYYQNSLISFKKSDKFQDNLKHTATWLQAGKLMAKGLEINPFNKDTFRQNLFEIRKLTLMSPNEFKPLLKKYCANSGVALVFVPEFKETHISGATLWITPRKALIIMSLRYNSNDHFWFTFFHEAAHILLHSKKELFIDNSKNVNSKEKEANRFAGNYLIPEKAYRQFLTEKRFSQTDIIRFSHEIGIHPAIVIGRLQYDKQIPYRHQFNNLKERFELRI